MKRLKLPIGPTVSFTISFNPSPDGGVEDLGSVDGATMMPEIETAKYNGGMFIWAATEVETRMNDVIAKALFPPSAMGKISPQGGFFRLHFLGASHLEFSGKVKILCAMIEERCLMNKKEREQFEQKMRVVMRYRNAFAHGKLTFDSRKGCILSYYTGDHKKEEFNNALVDKLQEHYHVAVKAIEDLDKLLGKPWPDLGLELGI